MKTNGENFLKEINKLSPDWIQIETLCNEYVEPMKSCIQDPVYHAEGDVWTHTKMVHERLNDFGLSQTTIGTLSAFYHDIAKPVTRTEEFSPELGRVKIGHPSHSRLGAKRAWHDLWLYNVDLDTRLEVYNLILWHQKVFHLWSYEDMQKKVLEYGFLGKWENLVNFARADNAGRICPNPEDASYNLDLLEEYLKENDLWDKEPDMTPETRMFYFEKEGRSPIYQPQSPKGSHVIVMSGLPGSGKDTFIKENYPDFGMVSPDDIREELNIKPTENQGQVVQAAYEKARTFLRKGLPFVWNGTNLTRQIRGQIIGLCRDYDAHVDICALDVPLETVLNQNQERNRNVPSKVIIDLAYKWEPPTKLEAHSVQWIHRGPQPENIPSYSKTR